jgi:hypothetical protein
MVPAFTAGRTAMKPDISTPTHMLVVAKRSARSAKIQTLNQIRHLSFTAPERPADYRRDPRPGQRTLQLGGM